MEVPKFETTKSGDSSRGQQLVRTTTGWDNNTRGQHWEGQLLEGTTIGGTTIRGENNWTAQWKCQNLRQQRVETAIEDNNWCGQ